MRSPQGKLIMDRQYYAYSSVVFYTDRDALLLNSRRNNLEYGSYAPGAPDVFIDDPQFAKLWLQPQRYYLIASDSALPRFKNLVGPERLVIVTRSGGNFLMTNQPIGTAAGSTAVSRKVSQPSQDEAARVRPLPSVRADRAL